MSYYSKRHYQLVSPPEDTPAQVAERKRYRQAAERGIQERQQRYPTLTAENAEEAIAFQQRRIAEILAD